MDLSRTQVTDAGLTQIAKISGLQRLYLNQTQVTDAGLTQIAKISGLQTLTLDHTQVTATGLKTLLGTKLFEPKISFNGLSFKNTPAARASAELTEISEIDDGRQRMPRLQTVLENLADPTPTKPPPTDVPMAPIFRVSEHGPIQAERAGMAADPTLDSLLEDLREKAQDLIDSLAGSNEYTYLNRAAQRYLQEVQKPLEDMDPHKLWSAANSLRRVQQMSERADVSHRPFDMLPPNLERALGDLIDTHGILSASVPAIQRAEMQSRDFATSGQRPEVQALAKALADKFKDRPDVLAPEDQSDLELDAEASVGDTPAAAQATATMTGRLWNIFGAVGRFLWAKVKSPAGFVGSTVGGHYLIQWVLANETAITAFLIAAQGQAGQWFNALITALKALL